MGLLAGTTYSPTSAVSKTTTAGLAMTALDTTNLRLSFTVPANGSVFVRMQGTVHGNTTTPAVLLGILQGSTVIARVHPMGALKATIAATSQINLEAAFAVSGLTPGASLSWDAAYGIEQTATTTGLKYGGPDDSTANNAWGAFVFEIWSAENLIASMLYDPATAGSKSTTPASVQNTISGSVALTFIAPAPTVKVRLLVNTSGHASALPNLIFGISDGSNILTRMHGAGGFPGHFAAARYNSKEMDAIITGLKPGVSYTFTPTVGVEIAGSNTIAWGGPNDSTTNNAWGAICFEIWKVNR